MNMNCNCNSTACGCVNKVVESENKAKGWECPKCLTIYSPNITACYICTATNNISKWAVKLKGSINGCTCGTSRCLCHTS